jgi:hypothetical protein
MRAIASTLMLITDDDPGHVGDQINLYDSASTAVDSTTWTDGEATAPKSWRRFQNGTGAFGTRVTPTRDLPNL